MNCGCLSHNGFLTRRGYAVVAQRDVGIGDNLELGLTRDGLCSRLDKSGSVSALVEVEGHTFDDRLIDEQHRRFLNGS